MLLAGRISISALASFLFGIYENLIGFEREVMTYD